MIVDAHGRRLRRTSGFLSSIEVEKRVVGQGKPVDAIGSKTVTPRRFNRPRAEVKAK
jgi:hypothetical protein